MTTRNCAYCRKALDESSADTVRFRPFCSSRCANIDLGRWLNGAYVIGDTGQLERGGDVAAGAGPQDPYTDDEG